MTVFCTWSSRSARRRVLLRALLPIAAAVLLLPPRPALGSDDCGPMAFKQLTHTTDPFLSNNSLPRPDRTGSKIAYSSLFSGASGPVYRLDAASGTGEYLGDSGNYYPYPSINDAGDKVVSGGEGNAVPDSYYNLAAVYLDDFTQPPASRRRRIVGGSDYGNAIGGEISGDGNRVGYIGYASNRNGYAWGHQIYLYDMPGQSLFAVGPGLSMPFYYTTLRPLFSLNGDGSRLAFVAAFDPGGQNADGNFELFLYQVAGDGLTQITRSAGGDLPFESGSRWPANSQQSINTSGTRLAFISNRDYTGENAGGDYEVFLYDTDLQSFRQLTFGQGGDLISRSGEVVTYFSPALAAPAIDGSGNRVVFSSRYDLGGSNPDQNWEIYMWDATGVVPRLVQVTNSVQNPNAPYGSSANDDPWISRDGRVVVFSSYSNLTGENAAGKREIFSVELCPAVPARCGDGKVDGGEECDDGADNSDTESNVCRTDCTAPRCGDNVVDDGEPNYEDCDDGNTIDGDDCPANCKLPMILSPRLILGKGLCEDQPQKIELRESGTNIDITSAPDVEYEWVHGIIETSVLNTILSQVKDYLKDRIDIKPDLKTAKIDVVKDAGEVRFTAGEEGIGLNLIRAKRTTPQGDLYSNRALVISGLRLVQAGSLKVEPTSIGNAVASVVSELLTWALGKDLPNPPMILFSQGPCDDRLSFIGRSGKVSVKSLKFDLLGGLITDVDLLGGIERAVGLIPGTQPLVKWAKLTGVAVASELLDFEVSSEAAKGSEKEDKSPPVTSDAVIEVTDSFSRTFPFFHGVVSSKTPGLSAVQATLDLGKCLGKASDNLIVWVAPSLTKLEIRNQDGHVEDPLNVPLNGERTAHAVGMLSAFQQGTEPIDLPFDPIGMKLSDIKKFIEEWIPGGKKITKAAGVPIELAYPRNVTLATDGMYKGGNNYFGLKFTYNPLLSKITINDLRLQTAVPNLPVVTKWKMPVPPNPPTPVASVDESAGLLTGKERGNGQVQVDVCVPFFTNDYSGDTNGVRVLGDEMAVEAFVYADFNGNGAQDPWEPGLPGWTVEVLSGIGNVITSGSTDAGGFFSVIVRQEQLPVGLNTFGLREVPQGGWTPTAPSSGGYSGIPITLGAVISANFGNFQDLNVSGVKFADEDGNGAQDAGEIGLPGWTIEFVDSRGAVHQAITGGDGSYAFTAPLSTVNGSGQSLVREVLQAGWLPIFPPGGSQDLITSAEGPLESGLSLVVNFANQPLTTPGTPTVTPTRTSTRTPTASATVTPTRTPTSTLTPSPTPSVTATRTPFAIIAGKKFHDRNGNGVHDSNEEAVAGWVMFLDDNGDGILNNPASGDGVCDVRASELCVLTDAGGSYGFAVTDTGVYTVREVQRRLWQQTTAAPPDLAVTRAGQSYGGINFGNSLEPARRGTGDCNTDDSVTVDEILLGVNIALGNLSISQCPGFDGNGDGTTTVDEIITAVNYALKGLPPLPPSPTPTRTQAFTVTPSATATALPSTGTPTPSLTRTASPSVTSTNTSTRTGTPTFTATGTFTATHTATPSFTPTFTASAISLSPTPTATQASGGVADTVAGRAVLVANGMSAFPAVITALVSGLKYGGTAGALTTTDLLDFADGMAAGNSCPAGGTATRTCSSSGGKPTSNVAFSGCQVPVPSGTVTVEGTINATASSGSCPDLLFPPWTAAINVTATFRDPSSAILLTVTANLTGTVSPQLDFFGSCKVSGADLTLSGTLASQFAAGGSVTVLFQNTSVSVAIDDFNSQCVPVNYAMTFNGPVQITSSSGGGAAAALSNEPLDVVFNAFVIRQNANANPTQTWMDGGVSSPCFGGGITLQTMQPLTQTVGQPCPNSGVVRITSPPGQPQILYLPGGQVGIDTDLDGDSDRTLGSCFDALSPICQAIGGSPTATPTTSPTLTATASPTTSATFTPTASFTHTETPTMSPTPSATGPLPPSPTATPTSTRTWTPTATATLHASLTPTHTSTFTSTPTWTRTPTPTASPTSTATATATIFVSATPTASATHTPSRTATSTPTFSATATATNTPTSSATITPTATATSTPSRTSTASPTPTATIGYCDTLSQPALIPDANLGGVTNRITVSQNLTISDLNVRLDIDHPWVGDLIVTLRHVQTNTTVTLIDHPGQAFFGPEGCGHGGISCTLDDSATQSVNDECHSEALPSDPYFVSTSAIDGGFRPVNALSAFNNQNLSGDWDLKVVDSVTTAEGILLGWCLVPNTAAPAITSFTCKGGATCTIVVGEPFMLPLSFSDANGNADHVRLVAYRDDGEAFVVLDGAISPPSGGAALEFEFAAFGECPGCRTTTFNYVAVISDTTGLKSAPARVQVTVPGS